MPNTASPTDPPAEAALDDILAGAFALLAEGADDPGSPWRNPALATVGPGQEPRVRTVVLRRFDPVARHLELHTDARSAKHTELLANPAAELHGWDAARRVQLRVAGTVGLHRDDAVAQAAWDRLRPASRDTYRVEPGPGTRLTTPDEASQAGEEAARSVFCVMRLAITQLEWLHLGQGSHRRARFTWAADARTAMWLVP